MNSKKTINMPIANKKRLLKDVVQLIKSPLNSHGIYYKHSSNNILIGHAMLIGPKNTPYENGIYFFRFDFNNNYPYEPPKLTYLTNDGKIRFNPNLYRQGKVCLSILNTWRGEQWTSCQSINTVLLTLVSILNNNPLLNEPGVHKKHIDINPYNKIIEYSNYNIAICDILESIKYKHLRILWSIEIENHLINNYNAIQNKLIHLESFIGKNKEKIYKTRLYDMKVYINYTKLLNKFNKLINNKYKDKIKLK